MILGNLEPKSLMTKKVLSFMKSVSPGKSAAGGRFRDVVKDEIVDVDWLSYSYGEFSWTTADIYHFEKYDLELKPEFIEYVLSRSYREA